ncbi:hypothetical protein, partial [Bartonella senegalensis]|uniref:hypothetical protein n=1 Tax=Bartonella senegalensis TaxID=1468418 RepID=UPI0005528583
AERQNSTQNGKNHELWGIKPPTAVKSKRIAVMQQNANLFKKKVPALSTHAVPSKAKALSIITAKG